MTTNTPRMESALKEGRAIAEAMKIERELAEANANADHLRNQAQEMAREAVLLRDQVKALKADKERLDWLDNQEGLTTCGFKFTWFNDKGVSLRQAVDAARK